MNEQQTIQQIYVHNWTIFPYKGQLLALIQPNYVPVPQPGFVFLIGQQNKEDEQEVKAFKLERFLCSISNELAQLWEISDVTAQLVTVPVETKE